jgi:hypothetical protein
MRTFIIKMKLESREADNLAIKRWHWRGKKSRRKNVLQNIADTKHDVRLTGNNAI